VTDPRLDPHHDARLSELIQDAVSGVEPGDGLPAIRSRTRTRKETSMSSSRNWLYAVGGAVAGTAAVIVAIAVASQLNDDNGTTPVANPSSSQSSELSGEPSPTPSATDAPTTDATGTPIESPVPVYYAGDGPRGTVLFREFQPGIGGDPVSQAAYAAVAGPPADPDYRTLWPAGTEATASYNGDVITVDLTGPDSAALHDRPAGMSKRDAGLAIQQVIYSVQGAAQERAGVQLLLDGQHSDQVLGEPASEPLANAPVLETLSLMSITSPEEGQEVSGTFTASGANNGFEASVSWEILQGDQVVHTGFGMADGWGPGKLFPWELEVDVSGLEPGTYVFVAKNDDPSGGAEGHGPDVDTRTIVVK
jgi:Immunoglobulin-like domain of bacterial spore germination